MRRLVAAGAAILAIIPLASLVSARRGATAAALPTISRDRLAAYDAHLALERTSPYRSLAWSFLGPSNVGGRANDVAVADRNGQKSVYVAFAGGGVWRTDDAVSRWEPVFTRAASTGATAVAVAPSNPDVVWLGTGSSLRAHVPMAGAGVFKSIDAGRTWHSVGLADSGTIGRIIVHPREPNIVYVAATGRLDGGFDTRGVFKTIDGGKTWTKIFSRGPDIGAWDLVMDPHDARTMYISTVWWRAVTLPGLSPKKPESRPSIFKSTDGGDTWQEVANGLPPRDARSSWVIGLDVARSRPGTLYAVARNEAADPVNRPYGIEELYRSDDGGQSWSEVKQEGGLPIDAEWSQLVRVDPRDEKTIYLMGSPRLLVSHDAGRTFRNMSGPHADHNAMWIDPAPSGMIYDCNDGGLFVLDKSGAVRAHAPAPTAQIYNVALDSANPFRAYGAVQDARSYSVTIDVSQGRDVIAVAPFELAPGGEATLHAVAPDNPNTVYATGNYNGTFAVRAELPTQGSGRAIKPTVAAGERPLRGQWVTPVLVSPHDPATVYIGYQYLYRSTNRGDRWERISRDLSESGPPDTQWPDQFSQAISTISESPRKAGVIYAGTDDGHLHVTTDAGKTWTELTANLPHKEWISRAVASAFGDGTVYVTQRGRLNDDFAAYLYRSTDYGKTWASLVANIPAGPVNVIREDPSNPDVLYAGTDFGVYVSTTRGARWDVLGGNLPSVPVTDVQIHPRDRVMVISTYGRGMWALDARGIGDNAAAPRPRSAGTAPAKAGDPLKFVPYGTAGATILTGSFRATELDSAFESGSPDGRYVAYHKEGLAGRVYLREPATGAERVLLDLDGTVSGVVWSPDSTQLAYTVTPPRQPERASLVPDALFVITIATGERRALGTPGTAHSWISDGTILLSRTPRVRMAGRASDIWLVGALNGNPRLVAPNSTSPGVLLADGRSIVRCDYNRIVLHTIGTNADRALTTWPGSEAMPLLSPDGRLLAFASDRDEKWALYVAPLDRLPIRDAVRMADLEGEPTADVAWWTATGTLAVRPKYSQYAVYRVNLDPATGHPTDSPRRQSPAIYPDSLYVSPDSRLLAYVSSVNGTNVLVVVDRDGDVVRKMEASQGVIGWRSDDELMLAPFSACRKDCRFATLNVRSGVRKPSVALPAGASLSAARYVPASCEVMFSTGAGAAGGQLKALTLEDGAVRPITTVDWMTGFAVSPDGRHIAISRFTVGPTPGARRPGEMDVIGMDGAIEKKLLASPAGTPTPAAWSPDGNFLLYYATDGKPSAINVQTNESWPLASGDQQPNWSWASFTMSWAPDRSFVVLPGYATWTAAKTIAWEGVTYEAVHKLLRR